MAVPEESEEEIDIATFAERHQVGGFVLDVREVAEYVRGRVPGAVNIPMNEVSGRLADLPQGRINVICEVGIRSRAVTHYLRSRGLDAVNVDGGTAAWAAQGWTIER